jgi:phosphate transport system permease protein
MNYLKKIMNRKQNPEDIKLLGKKEIKFNSILKISAITILVILFFFFITLMVGSFSSIKEMGLKFIFGTSWDPVFDEYGAWPFIVGTLLTSFLALIISLPFALAISLFLGEYYRHGKPSSFLKSVIELLAGIPSVIYGFWGVFVLVPIIRNIELALGITPYGVGIFTAAIVLAIMIIPYSTSISREVIQLVPHDLKEAALSLGATRYEMIKMVVLPYAKSGIFAGILLSLGRALGETMAVTMVIGNTNEVPNSIFSPANTIASVIANDFGEATSELFLSSLIQLALILFLITTVINLIGKYIIKKNVVEVS